MEDKDNTSTNLGSDSDEVASSPTLSGSSSIRDVFSFAENPRTKICLVLGLISSVLNGLVSYHWQRLSNMLFNINQQTYYRCIP